MILKNLKSRVDDFLGIVEARVKGRAFVIGDEPTIVDLSMCAYLSFPKEEAGYDLAVGHPAIHAWLGRIAELPGWKPPYELLPGQHLPLYV